MPSAHGRVQVVLSLRLRRLYSLYGATLEKALSIVDVGAGNVSVVRGELSGRFLFQVVGSDVRPYTCTLHHCSCPAYTNTVVLSNDSIYVSTAALAAASSEGTSRLSHSNSDTQSLTPLTLPPSLCKLHARVSAAVQASVGGSAVPLAGPREGSRGERGGVQPADDGRPVPRRDSAARRTGGRVPQLDIASVSGESSRG